MSEGVQIAFTSMVPFLGILVALMLVGMTHQPLSMSLAYWTIAIGAVLSLAGAIRPERLAIVHRDIVRSLGGRVSDQPTAPTRANFAFGFVIALLVLQMWLEAYYVLSRHVDPVLLGGLGNLAWIGAGVIVTSMWVGSRENRTTRIIASILLIAGLLLGNIYTLVALGIILIAAFLLYPVVNRVARRAARRLHDDPHPDWISPLLFVGLSAVAAGSVYVALQVAPPVRWW